jgi:hypothetical protein
MINVAIFKSCLVEAQREPNIIRAIIAGAAGELVIFSIGQFFNGLFCTFEIDSNRTKKPLQSPS